MEKMFSVCVSSQKSGGAGDPIHPEVSPDRQILRFTASLSPGSKVEVKFRGKEVAGSPFTYHVPPPGPATDDLRSVMKVKHWRLDLLVTISGRLIHLDVEGWSEELLAPALLCHKESKAPY